MQTIQPEGIGEWAKESGDIRKRSGRVAVERMRKLRNVSVLARELEIDLHKNANGGIEPPRYANPS